MTKEQIKNIAMTAMRILERELLDQKISQTEYQQEIQKIGGWAHIALNELS